MLLHGCKLDDRKCPKKNSLNKILKVASKNDFILWNWKTKQKSTQLFDLGYRYDGSSLTSDKCLDRVTDSKKYSSDDVDEE